MSSYSSKTTFTVLAAGAAAYFLLRKQPGSRPIVGVDGDVETAPSLLDSLTASVRRSFSPAHPSVSHQGGQPQARRTPMTSQAPRGHLPTGPVSHPHLAPHMQAQPRGRVQRGGGGFDLFGGQWGGGGGGGYDYLLGDDGQGGNYGQGVYPTVPYSPQQSQQPPVTYTPTTPPVTYTPAPMPGGGGGGGGGVSFPPITSSHQPPSYSSSSPQDAMWWGGRDSKAKPAAKSKLGQFVSKMMGGPSSQLSSGGPCNEGFRIMQHLLNEYYQTRVVEEDCIMGPETAGAVTAFQAEQNLPQTGTFDSATHDLLVKLVQEHTYNRTFNRYSDEQRIAEQRRAQFPGYLLETTS